MDRRLSLDDLVSVRLLCLGGAAFLSNTYGVSEHLVSFPTL